MARMVIPIIDFGRSGGYRVLAELATQWRALGHDVSFLVPDHSEAPYFPTEASVNAVRPDGSPSVLGAANRLGLARLVAAQSSISCGLRRIPRPDLVLANHSLTVAPSLAGARRSSVVQYVQADERDYALTGGLRGFAWSSMVGLAQHAPVRRVVNGPSYGRHVTRRSLGVVPPGIDLSVFRPRQEVLASQTTRIGTICRSEPWKGTASVVAALRSVQERHAEVEVSLAFDAEGFLEGQPWRGSVELVRPDGDSNLAEWYRSLDVYVAAPIGQDGAYHYPVVESLACGLVLVSPPYAPASSRNAWVSDSRAPEDIAQRVESVLSLRSEAKVRAARGPGDVADLDWARVAARFLALVGLD